MDETQNSMEAPSRIMTWLRGSAGDRLMLLFLIAAGAGLAEISASNEWVSQFILPAPSDVWRSLVEGLSGRYWPHISSTLYGAAAGFAFAAVGAIAAAGIMVASPRFERIVMPVVIGFQSMPKIAIAPIVILWLGFGMTSKVVIVAFVCFFPILLNTLAGLKIRDRQQFELMRSLGASRLQMFRYLRVPNAWPYIFAGFQVGAIFALLGAVVAEFVGAGNGLGYFLLAQRSAFNPGGVYAILIVLMAIGLAARWLTLAIEKRVVFWSQDVSHDEL